MGLKLRGWELTSLVLEPLGLRLAQDFLFRLEDIHHPDHDHLDHNGHKDEHDPEDDDRTDADLTRLVTLLDRRGFGGSLLRVMHGQIFSP
jgi:hypothetical protein